MGDAVEEVAADVAVVASAGDGVAQISLDHAEDGLDLPALAVADLFGVFKQAFYLPLVLAFDWVTRVKVEIQYATPGSPWANGHLESSNAKSVNELLMRELFDTPYAAMVLIERWRVHNKLVRPRSSSGWGDLPGNIDIGMSRSTDGGLTWEPMKVIADMGDDPAWAYDGVGDPAILVDTQTGTIWVAGLWSHGQRGWRGSEPGLTPEQTGQLLLFKSDDDGVTWSDAINITTQVKSPDWRLMFQGPGSGITMQDGTLVFAAQFKDASDMPYATIITSRDHGKTWQCGTGAKSNTTEAQVVELEDGSLMLNMRDNRGGSRSVCLTRDLGKTWTEHPSSRSALPEPVCQASLIRVDVEGYDQPVLLFSNPAVSDKPRRHMTIKASFDGGNTWPEENHLLIDAGECAGYSSLTMIDKDTIGILYEGNRANMTFMRIPLAEALGKSNKAGE